MLGCVSEQNESFRCCHITDIGIGYISTMLALTTLYLRWCTQIRDFGLQHICGMRNLTILSLAGETITISLIFLDQTLEGKDSPCPLVSKNFTCIVVYV